MKNLEEKSKPNLHLSKKEKKKNSPSTFQLFFWKIAGSEISILEKCQTDWNKHVGIGMAIFMTTLLAFFSGTYAAYFFTDSLIYSSLFGVLWSALIYSIDRSLVVTLKKTPTKKWFDYILPFILRGSLALVIAFVISIPLELLIFKENIEIHTANYDQKQVGVTIGLKNDNQSTKQKESIRQNDSTEYARICSKLRLTEPDTKEYSELMIEKTRINNKLRQDFSNKTYYERNKRNQLPLNHPDYTLRNNQYKSCLTAEKTFQRDSLNPLIMSISRYKNTWFQNLRIDSLKYKTKLDNINGILEYDLAMRDSLADKQDSLLSNKKGFVRKFMILEDLASGKSSEENPEGYIMWLILWLIRFIFILVELLPTIVKTASPLGNYDLALWQEEQNFAKSLSDGELEYRENQAKLRRLEQETLEKQAMDRNFIQEELNKSLLKEIAAAQDAVARQKINEYKEKHLHN
jgi:hypothetical protein